MLIRGLYEVRVRVQKNNNLNVKQGVIKLINKTKNLISKTTIILKYEKFNSILQRPLLPICQHLNNPVYVARNGN